MQTNENKQKILNALANVTKQLRGEKVNFYYPVKMIFQFQY